MKSVRKLEKIKVLMIGPDRSVHGGISGVVNNYYDAGLNQKIDLCYIGTMMEGSKFRKLLKAVTALGIFCLKVPSYQIVHVNMASDSSYYRKSIFIKGARFFRKKIVIHQHGGDFENFYYRQLNDKGRKNVDKVLSMGDAFLVLTPIWKKFFSHMVDADKITVLPNSIQMPQTVQKKYGQSKLLFLGRICREKGIGELLKVISELKKNYQDIHLYLGGIWEDNDFQKEVEKLSECVTWLGWISGKVKEKYLGECDIFVLPSYFEGQPVALLEAMAYGCAIVASETGGIPHMITDGQTGILVTPRDEVALRQGIERALTDRELCHRLGENARHKVQDEFSIDKNMEELLQVYRKVLMHS